MDWKEAQHGWFIDLTPLEKKLRTTFQTSVLLCLPYHAVGPKTLDSTSLCFVVCLLDSWSPNLDCVTFVIFIGKNDFLLLKSSDWVCISLECGRQPPYYLTGWQPSVRTHTHTHTQVSGDGAYPFSGGCNGVIPPMFWWLPSINWLYVRLYFVFC